MSSNTLSEVYTFSPVNVASGCALWLDAADTSSMTFVSNAISQWNDKSGNNRHVSQASAGARPPLSNGGVYFNYGALVYNGSLGMNGVVTGYMVNQAIDTGSFQRAIDVEDNNKNVMMIDNTQIGVMNNGTGFATTFSAYQNLTTMFGWNMNVSTAQYGINGSNFVTNPSGYQRNNAGTSITIGNSVGGTGVGGFRGYIYEVIFFTSLLTTAQRQQIEGYLAYKWGLRGNLPVTHPYKNNPPYTNVPSFLQTSLTRSLAPSRSPFTFFNPINTSLGPTCILWIDAQDSFYTRTTGKISAINDKSGFGGALTTSLGSNYYPTYNVSALNGFPCFQTQNVDPGGRFYGTFGASAQVSRQTYTAIAIATPFGVQNSSRFFSFLGSTGDDYNSGPGWSLITTATSSPYAMSFQHFSGANSTPSTAVLTSNVTAIQTVTGTATVTGTIVTWGMGLATMYPNNGGGALWGLNIGEFLVYNGTMTQANYQQVEGYLAWKWNAVSALPANHPYKNRPPGLPVASIPLRQQFMPGIFSPLRVSGCQVWLDATDVTKITLTGATSITTLRDKSANAYSFTVPVSNPTYTAASNAVTFSPSQDVFFSFPPGAMNNASKYVFLIVANYKSASQQLFAKQYDYVDTMNVFAIGRNGGGKTTDGQLCWQPKNATTPAYQTGTVATNTKSLAVVWFDGSVLRFRINGSANSSTAGDYTMVNNTSASSSVGPSMCTFGNMYSSYWRAGGSGGGPPGGGGTFNWDLHEFTYYNNDVGIANIQVLEGYLAWKWGLVANLPSNHPYKKWAPPP